MFRRIFLIGLVLLPVSYKAADAKAVHVAVPQGRLTVAQRGPATVLTLDAHGQTRSVTVPAEAMIGAGTLESASLIGVAGAHMIVLTTYASQTGKGGPLVQCAAGEESFVRVVRFAPDAAQESVLKIASCWDDIDGGAPSWDAQSQTLRVDDGSETVPSYTLTADGQLKKVQSQ